MARLFGTDGIRGTAGRYPLDPETVLRVGRSLTGVLARGAVRPRVVVGRDTRRSGAMLTAAVSAGVAAVGGIAVDAGVCSTPCVAYLTRSVGADAGIVISASHNPFEDNGIKIFDRAGFKLPDDVETAIEALLHDEAGLGALNAAPEALGDVVELRDVTGRDGEETYVEYLAERYRPQLNLAGTKVVVDAAHGGAFQIAPALFRALGADVILTGDAPDGININDNCGSQHPQTVQRLVRAHGAVLGIALDGDADRLIAVDEHGEVVDGDAILALCADHLHRHGRLKGGGIVATVMSNLGLDEFLRARGLVLERTAVGDRYVVERMREKGYNLGGEQSGHLVFLDHTTTGDGVLGALELLGTMAETGRPLSELAAGMQRYPQVLVNAKVKEKRPLEALPETTAHIARVEHELAGRGRVLVRYSGTEAKVRVMVEGPEDDRIRAFADDLVATIVRELGRA